MNTGQVNSGKCCEEKGSAKEWGDGETSAEVSVQQRPEARKGESSACNWGKVVFQAAETANTLRLKGNYPLVGGQVSHKTGRR